MAKLKDYLARNVSFSLDLFARGDPVFAPVLTWQWSRDPTNGEIEAQLAAARRAGFGTVYVLPLPKEFRPDTMETELEGYLSPRYFARIKYALERAVAYGLRVWLYDEGGWPSGAACGQVLEQCPETRKKQLVKTEADGFAVVTPGGLQPDIYSQRAAACFADITIHACAGALGAVGTQVDAVFTDEPAGAPNAVSEEICERFRERFAYSLEAHPAAVTDPENAGSEEEAVRRDYFTLLGDLFRETMGSWRSAAAAHGWLFTGHLDRDHTADSNFTKGYGNVLAALGTLDIPGVDAIAGQIRSTGNRMDGLALDFYPRFASSAAALKGAPLALSEVFAVYGNSLSGDEMRYIVNYQLVRGINLFNFMMMPVSLEKWNAFGERPYFRPEFPGFYALDSLCEEIGRECLFMAAGVHRTDTALFYPYEDMLFSSARRTVAAESFRAAGEELERSGIDFDLLDADTICAAAVENGTLCCGAVHYARVVVPENCAVPPEVRGKLALLSGKSQPFVQTDCACFLHRAVESRSGELHICVFNQSREQNAGVVRVRTEKPVYRLDPKTGKARSFRNGGTLTLAAGQCALLFVADRAVSVCEEAPGAELALTPVTAAQTARFSLSEAGAALREVNISVPLPVCGGAVFPQDFCGEITCGFTFQTAGETDLLLSLSALSHFAEVFVNGARAGSVCTAPYELRVDKLLLKKGNNELVLKVANLVSPAYAAFPAEVYFEKKKLGPYYQPAKEEERQVSGGGFSGLRLSVLLSADHSGGEK